MPLRVAILGSTGSIGQSALSVVDTHPDRVQVVALAAGNNVERLTEQVRRHRPSLVSVATAEGLSELKQRLPSGDHPRDMLTGAEGLLAAATHPDVDLVLCASSGAAGLEAALAAIAHRKTIALANKEVLVMAGALMMDAASRHGVALLPVDSEHNAIHQCLHGRQASEVRRLVLTASGGPFRLWEADALTQITPADALRHPTWQMGRKITIDSATLMNKGLEVIEARWLFNMSADRIDVVVHPQSIVHSMVELTDGSVIAQLGVTDMRLPIQYAFSYPDRWAAPVSPIDLTRMGTLEFAPPDTTRFPCLRLAYAALAHGGRWPVVLNAANEIAVQAFLDERLRFVDIPVVIEQALDAAGRETAVPASLADVRATDEWARRFSADVVRTLVSKD